ncbi:MAG: ribosome maturation factor RimM [Pyrinomonadaceae bacterium]
MSRSENDNVAPVVVARFAKPHGLKGEITADLLTDFPERFADIDELILLSPTGQQLTATLEGFSFHKNRVVLKLAGIDSVEAAGNLTGSDFAVRDCERVRLPEGSFYEWELEGCQVSSAARGVIGKVRGVMRTGGVELLVVVTSDGKELLVPMAAPIIVEINMSNHSILIDPPEGLLEL